MSVELETASKIAIIGPSGAGKTTLAKKLGPRLGSNVYHLDRFFWQLHLGRFFWQPRWRRASSESRIDTLEQFVWEKSWIIEGTYVNSSEVHLIKANAIIYLDMSPFRCCWRIIKRHFESQERRRDIPEGSSDRLTLFGILRVLFFPLGARRKLENKLRKFPEKVIRLQSPEEVERFLAQFEPSTNEKIQSSPSNKKKKDPVMAR
jgi:shikimate kinase